MVAAVWCLSTFIIISLYRATLISYITLNRPQQLIHSAEELVQRPDVHLIVEDGLNVQAVLTVLTSTFIIDFDHSSLIKRKYGNFIVSFNGTIEGSR